jgi:Putative DNA-binding domain
MDVAFHYVIKIKLIKYLDPNDVEFFEREMVFENNIPIIARKNAFIEYEEWIRNLYLGMPEDKNYISDKQARLDLLRYFQLINKGTIFIKGEELTLQDSIEYGIGIYFVIDKPFSADWQKDELFDKVSDEYLIHGIGTSFNYNDPLEISDALNIEILYYEHYCYDNGGLQRQAEIYDWDLGEVTTIQYLDTPFEWPGVEKNSQKEEVSETDEKDIESIEKIIANGEGNQIEFKPALLYNFKTNKGGIGVKAKIATAICSFLNANGGMLFIGLDDHGNIQGLDWDFSLADGKTPRDFFQNEFDQMLEYFLTFSVKANISANFYSQYNKEIFCVVVRPSKYRPIFIRGINGKEFWVRGNAGNRQLTDVEELANYCISKWGECKD